MALSDWTLPPIELRDVLGLEAYEYLLQLHRHVYGIDTNIDGTLNSQNIVAVEGLKTTETDASKVLQPTGDGATVEFTASPGVDAQYLTLAATSDLPNERVFTPGQGLTGTDAGAGSAYTLSADAAFAFAWMY